MKIREFIKDKDYPQVRQFTIDLQDFERRLDPRMPTGESIADQYMANMFKECEKYSGRIFVAEIEQELAGYLTVLCRYVSKDIEDGPREFGYVTDLFISANHRGMGIGKALLTRGEKAVQDESNYELMIGVLAQNTAAKTLYQSAGYQEFAITLEKKLPKEM